MSDVRIVIALDSSESSSEDLDLPDRCRVVKLANSVTYDRFVVRCGYMEKGFISLLGWKKRSIHLRKSHSARQVT